MAAIQYSTPDGFLCDSERKQISFGANSFIDAGGPQHLTGAIVQSTRSVWQILWSAPAAAAEATFWAFWK